MDKNNTIKELELERENLLEQANSLSGAIDVLKRIWGVNGVSHNDVINGDVKHLKEVQKTTQSITGFPYSGGALSKAIFVIKEANRFLTKAEIYNRVDEILGTTDFRLILTSQLSIEATRGTNNIARKQIGQSKNNTVWGFLTWLDEKGEILPEHIYNENALQYKN